MCMIPTSLTIVKSSLIFVEGIKTNITMITLLLLKVKQNLHLYTYILLFGNNKNIIYDLLKINAISKEQC